mmetsp:Transcript_16101/g.31112  ORF Transcript_16101/g.31112 Transcript_16101/m.31112 type:complete len:779 (-) Transcript_16101:357-2693(-)
MLESADHGVAPSSRNPTTSPTTSRNANSLNGVLSRENLADQPGEFAGRAEVQSNGGDVENGNNDNLAVPGNNKKKLKKHNNSSKRKHSRSPQNAPDVNRSAFEIGDGLGPAGASVDNDEDEDFSARQDLYRQQDVSEMSTLLKPAALRDLDQRGFVHRAMLVLFVVNTALLLYSHLGTSGLIVSNIEALTGNLGGGRRRALATLEHQENACNSNDATLWKSHSLSTTLQSVSSCISCLGNSTCMTDCIADQGGFSTNCALCFADVVDCAMMNCLGKCAAKPSSTECTACVSAKCAAPFTSCSGLELDMASDETQQLGQPTAPAHQTQEVSTSAPTAATSNSNNIPPTRDDKPIGLAEVCGSLKPLYKIQFLDAVSKAWNHNARLLAAALTLASGVWPYVKNVLLLVAWLCPMVPGTRSRLLLWLGRLGKWSFVDVFVMLLFNATLRIEKRISNHMALVVFAVPQSGIYAFCAAATFALIQSEWMRQCHEQACADVLSALDDSGRRLATSNGRLRSGWRTTATRNLVRSQFMNERASLYVKLLVPMVGILSLLVGFYGTTLITYELKGSLSFLPGQNVYSYSVAEIIHSIYGLTTCQQTADYSSTISQGLFFWIFLISVLGSPLIAFLAVGLVWVVRAGVPCNLRALKQTLLSCVHYLLSAEEVSMAMSCLDVFLVSLLLVSAEISKVVEAVAGTVGSSWVTMSLEVSLGMAVLYLALPAVVLFALQVSASQDVDFFRKIYALVARKGETRSTNIPDSATVVYDQLDVEDPEENASFLM